jgi:phage recombination protein Bet
MVEQNNGAFNIEGFTVTKGEGRLLCSCGTNRCSHIAQVSAYLNNNRGNSRATSAPAAPLPVDNAHAGASAPGPLPVTTGFEADDIKALEIMRVIPEGTPAPVLRMFSRFCADSGLSPFKRQIYLQKRKAKKNGVYVDNFSIEPGIDGLRAIAEQTGNYAGSDDAVFEHNETNHPVKATVTVWKLVKGVRCPFTASARWDEYVPQEDWMWRKMPHGQLEKCAEAKALRKAFPNLAGMYVPEEMERASVDTDHNSVSVSRRENDAQGKTAASPNSDSAADAVSPGSVETTQSPDSRAASETKGNVLPAQQNAIRSLCRDINRDPDEWLTKIYGVTLETCSQAIAKKAIPTLNLLRSTQVKK